MLEEGQAIERILASTPAPQGERVPLAAAQGRFLLGELLAEYSFPGFDQSAMDGYALLSSSVGSSGARLQVVGCQSAGDDQQISVGAGEAVRVFTGAALPAGADAVVMQEDVVREGDELVVPGAVLPGEFIRYRGEILCRGQRIAVAGDRLHAGRIGLLASQGVSEVEVGRLPRVAVISTGNELVPPGSGPLGPAQIYDSNSLMLAAAARSAGVFEVECHHVADDLQATVDTVQRCLEEAEVLLVAGGVSVGDRDFVRPALERCGVDIDFWKVRMKPGKPFVYGLGAGDRRVFGLPGNPVSALVCFAVLVRPALLARMGALGATRQLRSIEMRLGSGVRNGGDRPHYLRGMVDAEGVFQPSGQQVSHGLAGLAAAEALLRLEPGEQHESGAYAVVRLLS